MTDPVMSDRSLVVVHDEPQRCPYLPDRVARMPLHASLGGVSPAHFDALLAGGYRRTGVFVYPTRCSGCDECQATRIVVPNFRWGRSFKRVLARADREVTWQWGEPQVDETRVTLYNRHRVLRDLVEAGGRPVDAAGYESFLVESCCQTLELAIHAGDRLVAVSLMDLGAESISMVYTYFDPDAAHLSLGTLAVLRQILWAIEHRRRYAYLGFYVADNPHLNYKSRFTPQQRLHRGVWRDVSDGV